MWITWIVLGLVAIWLYLLPAIVADARRHRHFIAISLLNVFLGWTFVGWVIALIWGWSEGSRDQLRSSRFSEKKCPMCAEKVKVGARICRFCGHSFEPTASVAGIPQRSQLGVASPGLRYLKARARPEERFLPPPARQTLPIAAASQSETVAPANDAMLPGDFTAPGQLRMKTPEPVDEMLTLTPAFQVNADHVNGTR
jgi:hypothetical protein